MLAKVHALLAVLALVGPTAAKADNTVSCSQNADCGSDPRDYCGDGTDEGAAGNTTEVGVCYYGCHYGIGCDTSGPLAIHPAATRPDNGHSCFAVASGAGCANNNGPYEGDDASSQGQAIQAALNACSAAVQDPCVCSLDHCD